MSEPAAEFESPARVVVVLSGRGSNFAALQDAIERGELPARIVLVVSNRADAAGLELARQRGISTATVASRGRSREEFDALLEQAVSEAEPDWICLAGYMKVLSARFVSRFPLRILNIHPSLLPAFPGLGAQQQALAYGARVSGCTVHLVDEEVDHGPVVEQRTVEIRDTDTVEDLAARILREEHRAYASALRRLLTEPWHILGRRVVFSGGVDRSDATA
jgi:phosphoribosylglycinamide formyltransferase 1